jgi:uncharacterized protein YjiS (DUF1127 family)
MAEFQNDRTYDSYIKEFMGVCSHKNVIRFINRLYNADFPLDSVVTWLETETHHSDGERRSDFMVKINERIFHIEVESNDGNGEMVFRMFEYGFRGAYMHGKTISDNELTLKFPEPIVIYLRSTDKTPSAFIVNVVFGDKSISRQTIPVKKLSDYTPQSLLDNNLYALSLFYPMKYEALLSKKHTDEDEIRFLDEATAIIDRVVADVEKGEISTAEFKLILSGFEDIFNRVISKAEILMREEVDGFMENIKTKYAFKELNWMAEARADERRLLEKNLKDMGLTPEQIAQAFRGSDSERLCPN